MQATSVYSGLLASAYSETFSHVGDHCAELLEQGWSRYLPNGIALAPQAIADFLGRPTFAGFSQFESAFDR